MDSNCPFCKPESGLVWHQTEYALAVRDGFPIAEGHTLVVPRKHVASLFELEPTTLTAIWEMVSQVRAMLIQKYRPDGLNIGVNDGPAAGQTVMHAHIHLIPRWVGDVPDPRGGVRWIMPAKARYWTEP
jgi:diadenosine tetraphosphate (Ap4A) HIT family hydrolase